MELIQRNWSNGTDPAEYLGTRRLALMSQHFLGSPVSANRYAHYTIWSLHPNTCPRHSFAWSKQGSLDALLHGAPSKRSVWTCPRQPYTLSAVSLLVVIQRLSISLHLPLAKQFPRPSLLPHILVSAEGEYGSSASSRTVGSNSFTAASHGHPNTASSPKISLPIVSFSHLHSVYLFTKK